MDRIGKNAIFAGQRERACALQGRGLCRRREPPAGDVETWESDQPLGPDAPQVPTRLLMKALRGLIGVIAICLSAGFLTGCSHREARIPEAWNQTAAAHYLDWREGWWTTWPTAARDHGTFCISCHTALPYALSRPSLRSALSEKAPSPEERELIDDVQRRVRLWSVTAPYYREKTDESRGTEAILDALILASYDARNGKLNADTLSAFDHMWTVQQTTGGDKGAWSWLQFDNEPWEASDSEYYGASLAAVAVGTAPGNYSATPEIQNHLRLLREYLERDYTTQTPINQVALLWASEKLPGVLDSEEQRSIINEVLTKQRSDGGWCLSSLAGTWKRYDGTPLVLHSDGYATGFITYVLQEAGLSRDDLHVERGLSWLVHNQTWWGGHWSAYSLNIRRHNPFSGEARFMDDAATGYAVLALTQATQRTEAAAIQPLEPSPCRGPAGSLAASVCR